jgi:hypothetical protein
MVVNLGSEKFNVLFWYGTRELMEHLRDEPASIDDL